MIFGGYEETPASEISISCSEMLTAGDRMPILMSSLRTLVANGSNGAATSAGFEVKHLAHGAEKGQRRKGKETNPSLQPTLPCGKTCDFC